MPNQSSSSNWTEASNIIAGVAALVAAIALVSSIRSCQISERALELATSEYVGNRAIILKGELGTDKVSIRLAPIDQAFLLQQIRFTFHKDIGGSTRPSLPPDFVMPIPSELGGLQSFVANRVPPTAGSVKVALEARVPFLIESISAIKGVAVKDRSLYAFIFGFSVYENPDKRPEIRPLGISFVRRLSPQENAEQELDRAWNEAKG